MIDATRIHLVGIGGIGMSGLARILRAQGRVVTGSDRTASVVTEKLDQLGVDVAIGEDAANVPADAELVIHTTAALPDENAELLAAAERGVPLLTYPQALGEITKGKKLVAVTGAHGKSTTTGMLIAGALAAGEDISCIVGTNLAELGGGNARLGKSDWFILEACEYRRAFLHLQPELMLVTNIEAEHPDYYADLADYQSAFAQLAGQTSRAVVINSTEQNLQPVLDAAPNIVDAKQFLEGEAASPRLPGVELSLPGAHNRKNAAVALAVATEMGLSLDQARQGIAHYRGSWRRFEFKGEYRGTHVYDDYAHHPTEIRATLAAARERYPSRRIVAVYQQHQAARAAALRAEIGASFADADVVLMLPIYQVREKDVGITHYDLVAEINTHGDKALAMESFETASNWLRENLEDEDDVVFVMGAGDISQLTEQLLHEGVLASMARR